MKGQRTIDGKIYLLGCRITGVNAKHEAQVEANAKRRRGLTVRIIKVSALNYLIYEH